MLCVAKCFAATSKLSYSQLKWHVCSNVCLHVLKFLPPFFQQKYYSCLVGHLGGGGGGGVALYVWI